MIGRPMMNLLTVGVLAVVIAQSAPRGVAVAGVVQDQTGAVLPGAAVVLSPSGAATTPEQATTDHSGAFRFEAIAPGEYDIRTAFPGFTAKVTHFASARVRHRRSRLCWPSRA